MKYFELSRAELAYLLATLSTTRIVGVNNQSLFPEDATERTALLAEGFAQLVQNQWLIPSDGAYNMNGHLMLQIAIVAQPDLVMLTISNGDKGQRVITHYQAGHQIVEQIRTSDNQYRFGLVEDYEIITNRILKSLGFGDIQPNLRHPINGFNMANDEFESKVMGARSGEMARLEASLKKWGNLNGKAAIWSQLLSEGRPSLTFEWAAYSETGEQVLQDLAVFGKPDHGLLLSNKINDQKLYAYEFTAENLSHTILTTLHNLDKYRKGIIASNAQTQV